MLLFLSHKALIFPLYLVYTLYPSGKSSALALSPYPDSCRPKIVSKENLEQRCHLRRVFCWIFYPVCVALGADILGNFCENEMRVENLFVPFLLNWGFSGFSIFTETVLFQFHEPFKSAGIKVWLCSGCEMEIKWLSGSPGRFSSGKARWCFSCSVLMLEPWTRSVKCRTS